MSSSNNDDFNNIFDSADNPFPSDSSTNESGEPDLDLDGAFGFSEVEPFASQTEQDNPFVPEETASAPAPPLDASGSTSSDELPFGDWSASTEVPDPLAGFDSTPDLGAGTEQPFAQEEPEVAVGKKGKKAKKTKKSKASKLKEPVRIVPWSFVDVLLLLSVLLVFVSAVAVDVAVFMKYQATAMNFFIIFNVLALFALLVPFLLFRQSRRGVQPNFYDVMLGLSLTLVIIAAIIVLCIQSVKYGSNIKAKLPPLPSVSVPTSSPPADAAPATPAPAAKPATPAATPAAAARPATPATTPAAGAKPATPAAAPANP